MTGPDDQHERRQKSTPVRWVIVFWLATVAAGGVYFLSRETQKPVDQLFEVIPSNALTSNLIDGCVRHEAYVYAYTRRSVVSLDHLRASLAAAGWKDGDGWVAVYQNPRPSYPGFFDAAGIMAAPMRHDSGKAELWAFDNGAVFARRRVGRDKRWSVPVIPEQR